MLLQTIFSSTDTTYMFNICYMQTSYYLMQKVNCFPNCEAISNSGFLPQRRVYKFCNWHLGSSNTRASLWTKQEIPRGSCRTPWNNRKPVSRRPSSATGTVYRNSCMKNTVSGKWGYCALNFSVLLYDLIVKAVNRTLKKMNVLTRKHFSKAQHIMMVLKIDTASVRWKLIQIKSPRKLSTELILKEKLQ